MKKTTLILGLLLAACATDEVDLPRFITDQQYALLSDTNKARYERFFDEWSRIPLPGDPDYVKTDIRITQEFVDAMNQGWVNWGEVESNIYRHRFNDKFKEAGPKDR